MTCQEVISLLGDFLEHELGPDIGSALEHHLQDCPPCVAYLNTYRKTRELTGLAERGEMPEEMRRRLRALLIAALRDREP
jgi:anti-sigma factor RsiW